MKFIKRSICYIFTLIILMCVTCVSNIVALDLDGGSGVSIKLGATGGCSNSNLDYH